MVPTKHIKDNEIYINKISKLLNDLDIKFNKIDNYLLAFVHRSLVNERPDLSSEHNERLEFLGDAVLELGVTTNLYNDYPDLPEGDLTNYRSSLVKGVNLAKVATLLNFDKYLILGKGEELSGGRKNTSLLANCVESFLGAVYLDVGYEKAKELIDKYIYSNLGNIINSESFKDYKSLFQEKAQAEYSITPRYEVLGEEGLDHDKTFTSGVYLGDDLIEKGSGSSKRKSQESAAKNACLKLFPN